MSDQMRVAVIGHTGRGDYGHELDAMWLRLPQTEVVAVADPNPTGLAASRSRLRLERGYADYREMLAEVRADIVAVAPRHVDQHRDMALAAIAAGARGIYMEKPFCRTPAEADEIAAACERRGVKLAVAHRNRYHPALPVVARLIEEGAVGKVLEMRARGREDARGGALDLWVLGSHALNLAHYLSGDPVACSATLYRGGRPAERGDVRDGAEGVGPIAGDELHARFEMARGFPLYFDSRKDAGNAAANFGLQVIGDAGIVDLRVDTEPLAHLIAGSPFRPVREPRVWTPIGSAGVGRSEPIADLKALVSGHILAARDLIAAIHEDRPPLCDARAARATIEMICAVFESHRRSGARVALPLKNRANPLAAW